jgi:tetratricopeptide (TPR) repeat protein
MELVKGPALSKLLHEGRLTIKDSVRIVEAIAEALQEAHKHGIIHRDIKPSNIVLSERNEPKVLDFGLAKLIAEEQVHAADQDAQTLLAMKTRSGVIVGTPLYLSPEQAMGMPVDARSDLFALGALLYECITGKPAFSGGGMIEIAAQIIHKDPSPPSSINPRVSEDLDRITLKALAKKPEERYQSASEMLEELRTVQEMLGDDSHRTQRLSPAAKSAGSSAMSTLSDMLRRPRLSIARLLMAALVLGLIAVTIWWFAHSTPYKPSDEALRWYQKGTEALRDGAYYQASQALEQAVAADSQFALAHARLGEAYTELDYTDKAREELLNSTSLVRNSTLEHVDALYLDAITATTTRNFALAIKSYAEIARLNPNQAHVYFDLGRAYEKNEETGKAIENYLEATKRDAQFAPAFLRVGMLYGRKQELASASSSFDRAETIYRAGGNFEGLAEVLYQRGLLLNRVGKLSESREQLRKALETARTTNNQYQQIKALLQLSVVSRIEGKTEEAKQYVTDAMDSARSGGIENLTTQGLIDLGNVYYARGDTDQAEKYFKQALEVAQRNKGRRNEARASLSLGSLYIQRDEPDPGLPHVQQALPFYQQGGYRRETSQALLLIGRAKRMKGDYQGALSVLEPQLQVTEQAGDKLQLALFHGDIGTVQIQQERYAEGLDHYNKSYEISSSLGNQLNMAFDSTLRGDALWRLGQYQEAQAAFNKASVIAEAPDGSNKPLSATIHLFMGQMALSQRQYADAMAKSRRAIELDDSRVKHAAIEARSVLGLAQALSGARAEGKKSCLEAVEMAAHSSDPKLLSNAMLALAEALLENGDLEESQTNALRAQKRFADASHQESEWRAWLIAGLASRRLNKLDEARERLSNAGNALNGLEKRWGTDHFNSYLARPDVQFYRKQLDKAGLTK